MSSTFRNGLIRVLRYIWVSPNSLIGFSFGLLGLMSGGGYQWKQGCIEFYGGSVTWLLRRIGGGRGVMAMTLGHTIIGQNREGLGIAREHEQVHVRQYERWGPLFLPAYLGCSTYLWFRKKDAYRDNPFEVEAYRLADPRRSRVGENGTVET